MLIVAFYFPPAGGGGVQRPLKLAQHLRESGVDVHVLAPDDPRWIHRDETLEIPLGVKVWRAPYFGPRGRKPAEELYDLVGARRLLHRAALFPRRLLLPDENVPWVLSAFLAAARIVRREQIDVVLTTSPPSSIHLVGAAVKAATGARWVADLRDSIAAKPDRRFDRRAVQLKELSHRRIATLVARHADRVVAVTGTIGAEINAINPAAPVTVIPNGIDPEDFAGLRYAPGASFRLTHAGSFFGRRDPRPTLEAIGKAGGSIRARFIGDFRKADENWLAASGLAERVELIPFVTHRRSLELQRDTEALLLLLPDGDLRDRDIPSGKIYEYLAAERPILAAVPPDGSAARIIRETESGIVVAPDDVEAIAAALRHLEQQWRDGTLAVPRLSAATLQRLSRRTRADELLELLTGLVPARATA